ncbi:hypothetical protein [Streptomyces sp. NRRL S-31]|uniref:hypothetical protein n=1 Tax=Streptomyces sp. NRRL S-31 TaxID=1463898 RepID=UPI000A6A16E9|nr:hypothetical protein [Streptomyces sp. NRRL S-31]
MSGLDSRTPGAAAGEDGPAFDGALDRREPAGADRPRRPGGADPWDARSRAWLPADPEARRGAAVQPSGEAVPPARAHTRPVNRPDAEPDEGPNPRPDAEPDEGPDPRSYAGPDARSGWERGAGPRRVSADPVKALLHRHRELCERAVDPLEIAAGLEAHGVTDRTAARLRHRDVFSLAEELYARVPHDTGPRPRPLPVPRARVGWALLALLPGALGAATVTGARLTGGHPRLLVILAGLLTTGLAVRAVLRHGPLAGPPGPRARRSAAGPRVWTLWLLGYAVAGDGLLRVVLAGGPDALPATVPGGTWPITAAPALALLPACAPAAWSAHLLAAGARRALARSRGLKEFTAAAKPLLIGVFALFLGVFGALLGLCGNVLHEPAGYPQALTLGALLLLARLLTVHRHRHTPALALGAAAATEAAALALPVAGRLPGCAFLAAPVETLVDAWGEPAVPTLACGTAALALLWHACRTLTRASAHAPTGAAE